MSSSDYRVYLCSNCYRRCLWNELSAQEHRCIHCRLSHKGCVICDRKFEPRHRTDIYCKRCDFHIVNKASSTPRSAADLELDVEPVIFEPARKCSMTTRWKNIKTATGIEDGYIMD